MIRTIILIIIGLIVLGYFGIHFEEIYNSPVVQENLKFAWELIVRLAQAAWNWIVSILPH
jgi:hypothetical protein